MWTSDQLGFSLLGPQLPHEVAFWCFMLGSMAVRSSGALPAVTHGSIWTRGEEVKGEKGRVCVRGYMQSNPGHAVQGWSKAGSSAAQCPGRKTACCRCFGDTLPKWPRQLPLVTRHKTHWSLGGMLRVICYKHTSCPGALERVTPARPDTGISNSRWLFWVLRFWCPQEPVSSVPCTPPGKLPLSSCFAKAAASLSMLTGTSTFDMQRWRLPHTRQHRAACSTLGDSMHSILNGNKPFRERSRAEGLEAKSSLGELGC